MLFHLETDRPSRKSRTKKPAADLILSGSSVDRVAMAMSCEWCSNVPWQTVTLVIFLALTAFVGENYFLHPIGPGEEVPWELQLAAKACAVTYCVRFCQLGLCGSLCCPDEKSNCLLPVYAWFAPCFPCLVQDECCCQRANYASAGQESFVQIGHWGSTDSPRHLHQHTDFQHLASSTKTAGIA